MTQRTVPVSSSVRVRDWLRAAPDGPVPVVHRGPHAVYVDLGGTSTSPRCVGVLAADAAAVPCGLRTRLADLRGLGDEARVTGGVLRLGGTAFPVRRLVDVGVPTITGPDTVAARPLGSIDPAALIGRGDGLTPYGDDVVCGWLAARRAVGVPTPAVVSAVREHLGRTTLLSATLLDCALHGECLPALAVWLRARGSGAEAAARARLLAVGGSSGAGLLVGAERALGEVRVAA